MVAATLKTLPATAAGESEVGRVSPPSEDTLWLVLPNRSWAEYHSSIASRLVALLVLNDGKSVA